MVGSKVRECLVGRAERVGGRSHLQPQTPGECQELLAVGTGVGGDAADLPFEEQVALVVERGNLAQVDAGDCQRATPVERGEGDRYEVAGGGEKGGGGGRVRGGGLSRRR